MSEHQLRVITKDVIIENKTLDKLRKQFKDVQDNSENLHSISRYSRELFGFLDDVRESGLVNMYQASDLLWSGSEWIE